MMTECGVCGKRIVIPDPMFYVYKRGKTFFCSKNCMIVHNSKLTGKTGMFRTERKEKDMNHRLTRDQKQKAVELALQGGDYMAYLKKAGAKNPSAAWWYIKATLEKANPEKYKELMKVMEENRPVVEIAEKLPPEAVAEVPEADPLAGFQVMHMDKPTAKVTELEKTDDGVRFVISVPPEQAEQMDKVLKDMMDPEKDALCMSLYNPQKDKKMKYTVMSIKTKAGTFSINEEEKISWMGGKSCTTMKKEDWEDLAEVLPEVLEILGEVNC